MWAAPEYIRVSLTALFILASTCISVLFRRFISNRAYSALPNNDITPNNTPKSMKGANEWKIGGRFHARSTATTIRIRYTKRHTKKHTWVIDRIEYQASSYIRILNLLSFFTLLCDRSKQFSHHYKHSPSPFTITTIYYLTLASFWSFSCLFRENRDFPEKIPITEINRDTFREQVNSVSYDFRFHIDF